MPKAIVVFSDGTGNSAAKLFKTNVWRLYQAIDLAPPTPAQQEQGAVQQIVYYDDGVGTSAFKPLALLGGAFGWGLKRNVLDLYTFLCRNCAPGDRIYAFGFSRGAFTIRILVGLVVWQHLLRCSREEDLARYARDAYRAYRRRFNTRKTPWLITALRDLRDRIIALYRRARKQTPFAEVERTTDAVIAFVGVWDTVAAYGMPVAELTRGIDEWIWPLSMPNYTLSARVRTARHALALDDERDTFHPLLWDEVEERKMIDAGDVAPDRLRQVWFSGMHSDVGGGYPDDSLAYVSLDWMLEQAGRAGLRFDVAAVEGIKRIRNPFGPMHDSRRGIAGYYRYQPRKIGARLKTPDPTALIMVDPRPKGRGRLTAVTIHETVLDRIRSGTDRYAPIVLPRQYEVVGSGDGIRPNPESPADAEARCERQEWAWNAVWKGRVNYFTILAVTIALASMPAINHFSPPSPCVGLECSLATAISSTGAALPDVLQFWPEAFAKRPYVVLATAAVIAALLLRSAALQVRIHDVMREVWADALRPAHAATSPAGRTPRRKPDDLVYRLRTSRWYQRTLRFFKWEVAPTLLVVGVPLAIILILVALS